MAMQVFKTVVEAGSFARAAEQLRLSTSATSRHVADLEKHLGGQLLQRSTRRLNLTEAGTAYYERCCTILADVEEAETLVGHADAEPRGLLRVSLPFSFGLRYAAPVLTGFCVRYPRVQMEVSFSDRVVDLVEEGVDVAVRISYNLRTTLIARPLTPIRLILCASPDYLQRRGVPQTPEDLREHDCLTYTYSSYGDSWAFQRDGREFGVTIKGSFRSNNGEMLRLAALAGQGIILQPTFIIGDDLRSGQLVRVLTDYRVKELEACAVYLGGARRSARVQAFVSYFREAFGDSVPVWDRGLGFGG